MLRWTSTASTEHRVGTARPSVAARAAVCAASEPAQVPGAVGAVGLVKRPELAIAGGTPRNLRVCSNCRVSVLVAKAERALEEAAHCETLGRIGCKLEQSGGVFP